MLLQEVSNELGSVGGEVVEDDMNLLPGRAQRHHFFEEGNEVTAGVAGRGSSVHAAGLGVQRGIQRKRSMPVVLETVTLGSDSNVADVETGRSMPEKQIAAFHLLIKTQWFPG
jgi:hypothetical protein